MHIFPLTRQADRMVLLREADHLLRRFGQLEVVDLAAEEKTEFTLRAEADRFLFPLIGSVIVSLLDLRETSPSNGKRADFVLEAGKPRGLLVPFGVACSLEAGSASRLIILATHSETHSEDRTATADELDKYTASQ